MANEAGCEGVGRGRQTPFHSVPHDESSRLSPSYTEGSLRRGTCQSPKRCSGSPYFPPTCSLSKYVRDTAASRNLPQTTSIKPGYELVQRRAFPLCSVEVPPRVLTSSLWTGVTPSFFLPTDFLCPPRAGRAVPTWTVRIPPSCIQRPTRPPLLLPMADNAPLGTGVHSEPPPTAMTSTVHRPFRPRSQITILDVDLASALSVAPAPHSWKDAEERVLSEFGGSFPGPASPDADPPTPQKGYFAGDLECVLIRVWKKSFLFLFFDRSIYIHKRPRVVMDALTRPHRARARARTGNCRPQMDSMCDGE